MFLISEEHIKNIFHKNDIKKPLKIYSKELNDISHYLIQNNFIFNNNNNNNNINNNNTNNNNNSKKLKNFKTKLINFEESD